MNDRADRAQAILDALDSGVRASRPTKPPPGAREVLCRNGCGAQLYLCPLPTGQLAPLERHPTGHLVIVKGIAVTYGESHGECLRFCFHRCQRRERDETLPR